MSFSLPLSGSYLSPFPSFSEIRWRIASSSRRGYPLTFSLATFPSRLAKFCTFGRGFVHFVSLFYFFFFLLTMSNKIVLRISVITQILGSLHKPSNVNFHNTQRRLVWPTEILSSKLKIILPCIGLRFLSSRKKEVWVRRWTKPPPPPFLHQPLARFKSHESYRLLYKTNSQAHHPWRTRFAMRCTHTVCQKFAIKSFSEKVSWSGRSRAWRELLVYF